MILDTGTLDAATLKALCDLLCRAYGTSGANPYKLNVAGAAIALLDKIAQAEREAAKPELVKEYSTPADFRKGESDAARR